MEKNDGVQHGTGLLLAPGKQLRQGRSTPQLGTSTSELVNRLSSPAGFSTLHTLANCCAGVKASQHTSPVTLHPVVLCAAFNLRAIVCRVS